MGDGRPTRLPRAGDGRPYNMRPRPPDGGQVGATVSACLSADRSPVPPFRHFYNIAKVNDIVLPLPPVATG